jgi:hypothetical protein
MTKIYLKSRIYFSIPFSRDIIGVENKNRFVIHHHYNLDTYKCVELEFMFL